MNACSTKTYLEMIISTHSEELRPIQAKYRFKYQMIVSRMTNNKKL